MIQKYLFNPGIFREGTEYDAEGGWFDCNLIRFRAGRPEKIGGWQKLIDTAYSGTARALHNWIQTNGTKTLGLGTNLKYYVTADDTYNDVTPIRLTTGSGDVTFAKVGNGDATITVSETGHGAVLNDFVTFSGAATLGGNITADVLNQEYQITEIVDANSFRIEAKDTSGNAVLANSSDSGNGGSSVVGTYQINVGLDEFIQGTGWGAGNWGEGTWGSTSSLSSTNQLRLWTHDNFGEDLIIAPRGGNIYKWDASNGVSTRAVVLSGIGGASKVPTKALQVITSEVDRHLIVLGADPISGSSRTGVLDPMLIAFSDQENEIEFNPTTTNTAGSVRLSSGSQIIGAVKSRQETVIFTDTSVYSMQFIGPPFTFGVNLIDNSTGLIAPKAAVTAPGGVYFMSYDGFYVYSGQVAKIPCAVKNYVFSDINTSQAYKIFAFSNNEHNEVGWYYPSADSSEIDRYVIYNYQEKLWYYGQMVRHAWLDSGVEPYPQATGSTYLYQHEFGFNDDGSEMTNVFIESGDFDIEDGNQFSFISRIIPDVKFIANSAGGSVKFLTKVRNYPGDSLSTASTSTVLSSTQQAFIRARGRQAVLRIESNDGDSGNIGTGWRLGATRLDVKTDGRR
jgi:hypothetical protein|tara:strand:- start:3197 stop:5059 length:1863 start_codon:yes stop_codon:yes gene_type:complete